MAEPVLSFHLQSVSIGRSIHSNDLFYGVYRMMFFFFFFLILVLGIISGGIAENEGKKGGKKTVPFVSLKVRAFNEERSVLTRKDSSLEEISPDEPQEQPTTDEKFETVSLLTPVEKPKMYNESILHEPKGRYIVHLDTRGKVGPNYELVDEYLPPPEPKVDTSVKTLGSLDTTYFEKEFISIDTSGYNLDDLRVKLNNLTLLEHKAAEHHKDLGSSFILPVLKAANYDNNTVPVAFTDVPVNVAVQLNVLYLADFNSELMEFSMDVEMKMSWFDLRLANNYTKPVRIREKEILDQIWRPDPYFVNSKYSYFHHVSFPNFRMRITPEGLVTYTMRVTSVCNCFMFFCLYPHDRQTCDVKISSIAYPSSFVRFHWHSEPILFQSNMTLPELQIQQVSTDTCSVEGKLIRSSCLRLVFELERDGARIIVEKYIPSTLAMMFAWVAPYVPYNYEEVRIVTPITVLLTLVQMEKGDSEIRTSYLTSLDAWFAAMKMFTVLSLIESLIVLALIKRSRAMMKAANRAANELERLNCRRGAKHLDRLYHRLDYFCRVAWPIVFIVFAGYYVLFVAQGDEGSCIKRKEMMR